MIIDSKYQIVLVPKKITYLVMLHKEVIMSLWSIINYFILLIFENVCFLYHVITHHFLPLSFSLSHKYASQD